MTHALSDAVWKTLRIGDLTEQMLWRVMEWLLKNDKRSAVLVSEMDDVADRLEKAVRLYITKLTKEDLGEPEARRAAEIISFAINLEYIGTKRDKSAFPKERLRKAISPGCEKAVPKCLKRHRCMLTYCGI